MSYVDAAGQLQFSSTSFHNMSHTDRQEKGKSLASDTDSSSSYKVFEE